VTGVTERLVVVGGDAAGMSAASQAKRLAGDKLEVLAFERGAHSSSSADRRHSDPSSADRCAGRRSRRSRRTGDAEVTCSLRNALELVEDVLDSAKHPRDG
jgi:thioredoxin reductase